MTDAWWDGFYDDAFADVVMDTGEDATAARLAAALRSRLELGPGDTVFDQCCGLGRISLPLARQEVRVIGVDVTAAYIRRAAAAASEAGLSCEFHVGDAFEFVPETSCDAAFNWASSFGYTPDDARNAAMLRRAWEALRPGGRFALDYYSAARLLHAFQPEVVLRYRTRHGEFAVRRAARIEFASGMIEQEWSYSDAAGELHRKRSRTKIYLPHELCRLLRECGFEEVELLGDVEGTPFTLKSPRCVLLARKPGPR